ncbi:MAG: patatin-like phospholipase family protein [Proteobacteria bacterium]|nr:patatin-like phospholipase family protein [Pseudomonadota bacterium]MBI3495925.1 patatin-like phospholipase family protein [Pseudomonadota bacterium]
MAGGEPYALSDVLRAEFGAIWPNSAPVRQLDQTFRELPAQPDPDELERARRRAAYTAAHALEPVGLALSGGGIRSASFALGVIQALAEGDLLRRFHYLSTVSGGGYIGAWLSAWLNWARDSGEVLRGLNPKRGQPDKEPLPIRHLRAYSSYLTPKMGILSTDLWTAVTIVTRNLLLNWLILIPALLLPIIAVKIVAAIAHTAEFKFWWPWYGAAIAMLGLVLTGMSFRYKLVKLYAGEHPKVSSSAEQMQFLKWSVVPAIGAGAIFAWLANNRMTPADALVSPAAGLGMVTDPRYVSYWQLPLMIAVALAVYAATIASAKREKDRERTKDYVAWGASAIVSGTLIWLGVHLCAGLAPTAADKPVAQIILVILGMPWFFVSLLMGHMAYVMLRSYSHDGDFEREWLGRAGAWYIIAALVWLVVSSLVLCASWLYDAVEYLGGQVPGLLPSLGAASGFVTALLGKSSLTSGRGQTSSWTGTAMNVGLAVAGPLFAAIVLILLSMGFDLIALDTRFQDSAFFNDDGSNVLYQSNWRWTLGTFVSAIAVMIGASMFVNVNRFSLHALYRNRLIRAFLGGPHGIARQADRFTGFDNKDNLQVKDLWPNADSPDKRVGTDWRPFHIVNIALNLAASPKLAWQHRKAESFTVTPLHCGTANLGYRPTETYGHPKAGISLGTAMAISGAAVSPNMGYHSSPSIAFLLTMLNVRLGWWLGNPGKAGGAPFSEQGEEKPATARETMAREKRREKEPYRQEAPRMTLYPLLAELFGMTNEDSSYVYLSDGGHFENLGLYELVRRRCRWIVVCDAGQDGARHFEDLGNAVRKIWIDLGVRITFEGSDLLAATDKTPPAQVPYCIRGNIKYLSDPDTPLGHILYIKPTVQGTEGAADVIAYERAHVDFPNQSTADQWFDEPQLESYRSLGYFIASTIIEDTATRKAKTRGTLLPSDLCT